MATLLEIATEPDVSDEFTVAGTDIVTLVLTGTDGGIDVRAAVEIQIKADGEFYPVAHLDGASGQRALAVHAPGVYRVARTSSGAPCGVVSAT
ncbi:hypothetical protein SAMN02983003_1065 [Devosia enhydra]|uniref:Uncharacterized protein n=1 Tax=Devosia enhydra TaxID=665118 RepID=A0A1K2HV24_9HYPH|nr:hypothetical protein [Devosia enhydra]SFZ82415.1 hypothetical protein SAMN02983003_1065 [Devosia enhydra]